MKGTLCSRPISNQGHYVSVGAVAERITTARLHGNPTLTLQLLIVIASMYQA